MADLELDENGNPITPLEAPGTKIEKFKNPEERDKAYLELEKLSQDQSRRLSDMESKMEAMQSYVPQQEQSRGPSFTDMYPSRQEADRKEAELAAQLLSNPSKVLADYGRQVREDTMREVSAQMTNFETVSRFKRENPDLTKHEEIVAMFVRRQPSNLTPEERLKRAGPEARNYLRDIAKSGNTQGAHLDVNAFTEAPSHSQAPVTASPAPTEEDDLTEFLKERRAVQFKKQRV